MLFWIITGAIVLGVLVPLARAMMTTRANEESPAAYDLRVYRDQLRDVDRDVARGVLDAADAERVRTEISRRILATDAATAQEAAQNATGAPRLTLMAVVAMIVVGGSFGLYLTLGAPGYGDLALADRIAMSEQLRADRPSQQTAESQLPDSVPIPEQNGDFTQLVVQLRTALVERPDDVEGIRLLARAEARLGNLKAARGAQARLVDLTGGPDAELNDLADYADMMILAAGGYVSPEAEQVLQTVLARDATHPVARYYWGLMQSQIGRPDRAFRLWDGLLREGPADAPWIAPIMAQINDMAARAGVRYQPPEIGSGRGPTQEDIDAAGQMSPAERLQMIEGMVSGLADRLANDGGPPQDWAQLISALGVLGRIDQAIAVYEEAKNVFGENPAAMDIINRAADQAGVL